MPRLSKIGAAALAAFGWTSGGAGAVTASYLQVAGGGGGGTGATSSTIGGGGGGGAGGLLTGTVSLSGATTYTVTVGAGGAGGIANTSNSTAGGNSQFGTLTASIGGGLGGNYNGTNAGSGGSGGGGAYGNPSGGAGTTGQGYAGGTADQAGQPYGHGGGGGAGAVGGSSSTGVSPVASGGVGLTSSITGTSTYYAGGGGAGSGNSAYLGGPGGLGGGGTGGYGTVAGTAGTANFGAGGGGGGNQGVGGTPSSNGGNGGSGVVIISYPAPQLFWGGFITTSGSNIIHTFTSSGSLTPITTTTSANYLVIAGGGSGGFFGAGGAGGALAGSTTLSLSSSYTIVVGAGGAGYSAYGSNSTFSAIGTIAYGGGYGPSASGGSGGGGLNNDAGGSGVSGQGYAGGQGKTDGATYNSGGGGGGGGGVGGNSAGYGGSAGLGGVGIATTLLGGTTYFAGGGGGGGDYRGVYGNYGGAGGGGTGGTYSNSFNGQNATISTGSGGGGAGYNGSGYGLAGYGGSGVVIIAYPGQQLFGGGVVSFANGNTIHTFTTSGTLIPLVSLTADYLVVAGGAGGGSGQAGGGGAGGVLTGSGITIDTNSTYLVIVGSGGAGGTSGIEGVNGTNSFFSPIPYTAIGGGGGGASSNGHYVGLSGGSGGGSVGGGNNAPGGYGTTGQGNGGGIGYNGGPNYGGGGGGGAGAVGSAGASTAGGAGGVGIASSISGTSTYYGGGGGGGTYLSGTGGAGGNGGGGTGGVNTGAGSNATAYTGGGGGGGGYYSPAAAGGNGGSGIVIIRYAGSTQLMAGGTVTISGGYVIHTFNSSGYLSPLRLIGNSLRFRSSVGAYLNRTPTVAGNRTNWTMSMWLKLGKTGAGGAAGYIFNGGTSTDTFASISSTGQVSFANYTSGPSYDWELISNVLLRDPAAWYNIVYVCDTPQATASNRVRVYVNNQQITSWSTATYPSQNFQSGWNSAQAHQMLATGSAITFDGYVAEVNFVDGQSLAPTSFGSFNQYGVWQPITYGGSYGTNGFYLPMTSTQSYAGSFNGSQGLTAPATSFNGSTGTWTVEGWAYSTNSGASEALLNGTVSGSDYFYVNYVGTTLYFGDGAVNTIVVSDAKPANQWFHWAAVKNGSTYTVYINGNAVGTSTTALRSGALTQWGIGYRTGYIWNGYISNVRINTTTAVYTSNFVPQTTPLTSISGTQLLTLQNATIVDNSPNAYTITNIGSVVTAVTYPFNYIKNIVKDFGPVGNNWTANNIGFTTGSTLDVMTDVPTLTSATAANYCVWNPLSYRISAPTTYSNANLKVQFNDAGTYQSAYGTFGIKSGKYYWEVTVTSTGTQSFIGIADINSSSLDVATVQRTYANNGQKNNGSLTSYGSSYTAGDVIGVAVDADNGTITFYKNNTSQGTAFTDIVSAMPSAGWTAYAYGYNGTNLNGNWGQQPFVYTPPSGYLALNTYNL